MSEDKIKAETEKY
jgi:peptidyl-prolyl cis-trans isomerase-like 4